MENTILSGVHQAIGNTPMVQLSRLTENLDGNIFAKLEYLNPGFSNEDRIALQIIEEAEKAGILKPNDTVVELTSGNTGTGLAIVCGVKGYKFVAVMSKGNSMERARMMQALGANDSGLKNLRVYGARCQQLPGFFMFKYYFSTVNV